MMIAPIRNILLPPFFSFQHCLAFLQRNKLECLHAVKAGKVLKWLKLDGEGLIFEISVQDKALQLRCLNASPSERQWKQAMIYVKEWLDLETDLEPFYQMAKSVPILAPLISRFEGLPLIGIPDLFEVLSWAIIGQQINLNFAYALKKRWVEQYGTRVSFEGQIFCFLPAHEVTAGIPEQDLRNLQFSRQKIRYLKGIAEHMLRGNLDRESLKTWPPDQLQKHLLSIKGVGAWTANYVMMKCFRVPTALPIQDAGLHQAIRNQLALSQKPSVSFVRKLAQSWHPFEAYATFYLWHSLLKTGN